MANKKQHGGARIGAGAPKKKKKDKKEPTKVMRIPLSKIDVVLKALGKVDNTELNFLKF